MKCAKCGAEIRTGCVYCSVCGQEAQIVTELNVLEDDLLRSMLEESKKKEEEKKSMPKEPVPKEHRTPEKRKKSNRSWIVTVIILAAVCLVAFGLAKYRRDHSVDYLMEKAQTAYSEKEYQTSLDYLDRVLHLESQNETAVLLKGEICALMKDGDQAETLFLQAIKNNTSCERAYKDLLSLYDEQGAYQKITALYAGVTDDQILQLFQDFIVLSPEIDRESGTYEEFFEVQLVSSQQAEIYYTLDGTTPTRESLKYDGPIEIKEQGEIVLTAVCLDKKGNYSEPVTAEYKIQLRKPDMPSVSPDGGQFTEAEKITVNVPEGTTVYYTWGGRTPGTNSRKYTEPLAMPEGNNILSLIAVDQYGMKSDVLKCNYIYYPEQ